jgi:hypothetical protein
MSRAGDGLLEMGRLPVHPNKLLAPKKWEAIQW